MKRLIVLLLVICLVGSLNAQKLPLNSSSKWCNIENPIVSDNGEYVAYKVRNIPLGSSTLVIKAVDCSWEKMFVGAINEGIVFTSDNKKLLYKKDNDSLVILTLGTDLIKFIPGVSFFKLEKYNKTEWLCYQLNNKPRFLNLENLYTGEDIVYENVVNWKFSDHGDVLILEKFNQSNTKLHSLNYIIKGKDLKLWEGKEVNNLVLDSKHNQLAFKCGDSVWYCKLGSFSAIPIIGKVDELGISNINHFSQDGKYLFISLKGTKDLEMQKGTVVIWSYRDPKLQSEQCNQFPINEYQAIINLKNNNIIHLQQRASELIAFPKAKGADGHIGLIKNSEGLTESWSTCNRTVWSLVDITNGERKKLDILNNNRTVQLSAFGKYLIYYDHNQHNYFSYKISNGQIRNLTKNIPVSWIDEKWVDLPVGTPSLRGFYRMAWVGKDEAILIYDQHDIWKIDPSNQKRPINLTNGYGLKNNIVFNLALDTYLEDGISKNESLILNAFNLERKDNGFYRKRTDQIGNPELLTMGPYVYNIIDAGYLPDGVNFNPIKAKNKDVYLIKRMSAIEAPNYYSTNDFRRFQKLSDLRPEKKYNWYTSELHQWKSLDGRVLQGILYKPEKFDPLKKYPVILHYYQRKSNGLNAYLKPDVLDNGMNINIPFYTSNDYLVFCPDIYYKVGDPMQGVYDAVVSATRYLSDFPFVNTKKIGLQGGSFGGLETNYLVTHTNIFAAAVSSSSLSNLVSGYGSLMEDGSSQQNFYEKGQIRMGVSLWENPVAYINNSPIFQIDKVTTPILIMHTRKDGICLYANAIEFFAGLRRMGKTAWMLVYSEGNHGVYGKEADDFSIRMMQFFDHYLKDKPVPVWMLEGQSALSSGLNDGLYLDTTGRIPGPGLLTPIEQNKVDGLMTRKPMEVTLR